jgi:hypothetical protein
MSLNAGKCTRKCNTLRSARTRIRTVWLIKLKNNTPNKPYGSVGRNVRARTLPELRVDLARVRLGRIILPDWREEEGAILVILRGRRAVREQGRVGRISPDARIILLDLREAEVQMLGIHPGLKAGRELGPEEVVLRVVDPKAAVTEEGAEAGEVRDRNYSFCIPFFGAGHRA